jgi:hypothetical protein
MLQVHVMWETDPLARWSEGVGLGTNKDIQWIIIAIVSNFQAFASFEVW